jgi:hypothetical protein
VATSNSYLAWATDPNANIQQPDPALIASGYADGSRPTAGNINWVFSQAAQGLRALREVSNEIGMSAALDPSLRLLGGGTWSYQAASGTLSWSDTFYVSVPGLADTQNAVAAGSVVLGAGACALFQANVPFSTTGDLTSGGSTASNLAYVQGISVGMTVSGSGIASGTTVTALSGTTATLSQAATATASTVALTFVAANTLTVSAQATSSLAPTAQTIVFARRYDTDVSVVYLGINSGEMALRDGEQKTLMGPGYTSSFRAVAAAAITQRQAVYANASTGQLAPTNVSASATANQALFVGFAETAAASGAYAHVVSSGVLGGFSALSPGAVYFLDPATPGGITNGKPSTASQTIVPVGVALTATTLLINPAASTTAAAVNANLVVTGNLTVQGTSALASLTGLTNAQGALQNLALNTNLIAATGSGLAIAAPFVNSGTFTATTLATVQKLVSAGGIKRSISMGAYATTSFPGSNQPTVVTVSGNDTQRRVTMAMSGSIMAISVAFDRTFTTTTAVFIQKNGTQIIGQNLTGNSNSTGAYLTFNKGTYVFTPGDVLSAFVNLANTGVAVTMQVEIVVESDA